MSFICSRVWLNFEQQIFVRVKCYHEGIRDKVKETIFIKVIDFLSRGRLKVEINREWGITHKFHIVEKRLYVLVLKFVDDSRCGASNLQVPLQRLFLYEIFIARKTLVCIVTSLPFFRLLTTRLEFLINFEK